MKLKGFEYLAPRALGEATALLQERGEKAALLAGGTDILVEMKQRKRTPECLIDVKSIGDLVGIVEDERGLLIGAATPLSAIDDSPLLREKHPMLADAAGTVGSLQVRNRATIGGNVCHASPSADTAPPLLALGALMRIVGTEGERIVPADEFFVGPGKSVLAPGELLAAVIIPPVMGRIGAAYLKHGARKAMELAVAGVAVQVNLGESGEMCRSARIGLGAVAPTPIRARRAEGLLCDSSPTEELIAEVAQVASLECKPITDIRASAAYRVEVVRVLTNRALRQALSQARSL